METPNKVFYAFWGMIIGSVVRGLVGGQSVTIVACVGMLLVFAYMLGKRVAEN